MRSAQVYYKNELSGVLCQLNDGAFIYRYDEQWFKDSNKPSISLTLPKSKIEFQAATLFPFFFNMIPEGVNKRLICSKKRIDFDDYFGILLEVASNDTIGAVKVIKNIGND